VGPAVVVGRLDRRSVGIGPGGLAGVEVGRAAGGRVVGRDLGTDGCLGTAAGLRVDDDGGRGRAVGDGRGDGGAASGGRDGGLGAGVTSGTDGAPSAYPADQPRTAAR
jgi:hypothetical protein